MPLALKSKTTMSADGLLLFIEVVNATGVYNAIDNPGGFGAPNPVRNTIALIFYGNHQRLSGDVLAVPAAYDPQTVSSFTLNLPGVNGVLDYFVFALPIYNPANDPYADGSIVWDHQDVAHPFIKKRVTGQWVTILPVDLIGTTATQKEGFAYPIPEMAAYRNQLNTQRLKLLEEKVEQGDDQEVDYDVVRNNFDFVDSMLDASGQDFCSAAYNEAQKKLERIEDFAENHPILN